MDVCADVGDGAAYVILDEPNHIALESTCEIDSNDITNEEERSEKHSAVWTSNATSILLKLYESKLQMLETPKKKTIIWTAISQNLKEYNIDMTPDQVRWKINALTKKYKQCIDADCRKPEKFKYFKEMDRIYAKYNVDCDAYLITELLNKNNELGEEETTQPKKSLESKALIEIRKVRLANRIESDRNQSKILLEKQWLVYLRTQEEQRQTRENMIEKSLQHKEQELEWRKRKLEVTETLEYKKIHLMEKELEQFVKVEREKFELMKGLLRNNRFY